MNKSMQVLQGGIHRLRRKWGRTTGMLPKLRFIKRKVLLFTGAIIVLGALALGLWIRSLDIGKLADPLLAPTQIMDSSGNPASEMSSSRIVPVPFDKMPLQLRQAVVAVEDRRFYDHSGVDGISIMRAAFRNVQEGGAAEGGSTITQQLAKNLFLSKEKTLSRKLTEAAYAMKIESSYDKDRILETYLNQIYFGEGQWGIGQAAKRYFGKNTEDLSLAESAMLAALPKAPSRYSPFKNMDMAQERRNLVLDLMHAEGYISEADRTSAKASPIQVSTQVVPGLRGQYASYVDAVIDEAIEKYGFTERQLLAGGLRIYTEMNPVVQQAMETVYNDDSLFPKGAPDQLMQSGSVIVDPSTGGVRGIVGNRGEHVFRGFNHATQLKRQPGSTFKPIIVYAPALEKGYEPESKLYDGPLNINGYKPTDWDRSTRGEVTLHEAVIRSWNIPAVWLLNEIGLQTGKAFAVKLGVPFTKGDNNLGLALGGLEEGVSPLIMAQAYSAFPNLGVMNPSHTIVKITGADGHVLAEAKPQAVTVMSPASAYTMTGLLADNVTAGTGKNAALSRPTAGKTGTTQLPAGKEFEGITDGSKDTWFVGYTPELVGAVWIGYDQTDRNHYLSTSGGSNPALVFREMMQLALKDVPVSPFKKPAALIKNPGQGKGNQKENDKIEEKNVKDKKNEKEDEREERVKRDERDKKGRGKDEDD